MSTHIDNQLTALLTVSPKHVRKGDTVTLKVTIPAIKNWPEKARNELYDCFDYDFDISSLQMQLPKQHSNQAKFKAPLLPEGDYDIAATMTPHPHKHREFHNAFNDARADEKWGENDPPFIDVPVQSATIRMVSHQVEADVTLRRTLSERTDDQALWAAIRNRTAAVAFPRYQKFIDYVLCRHNELGDPHSLPGSLTGKNGLINAVSNLPVFGPYAYGLLKLATQAFLTLECGVVKTVLRRARQGGGALISFLINALHTHKDIATAVEALQVRCQRISGRNTPCLAI